MDNDALNAIFEQINNLKKPETEMSEIKHENKTSNIKEILNGISQEIQRVLDENNLTQEDLCRITNMSQSNISKIQNGKVVPRIETLQKIANLSSILSHTVHNIPMILLIMFQKLSLH